jgi:hypothetical protein
MFGSENQKASANWVSPGKELGLGLGPLAASPVSEKWRTPEAALLATKPTCRSPCTFRCRLDELPWMPELFFRRASLAASSTAPPLIPTSARTLRTISVTHRRFCRPHLGTVTRREKFRLVSPGYAQLHKKNLNSLAPSPSRKNRSYWELPGATGSKFFSVLHPVQSVNKR